LAFVNAPPTSVNAAVRDAAAKTVMFPVTGVVVVVGAAVVGAAVVVDAGAAVVATLAAVVAEERSLSSPPHAAATSPSSANKAKSRREVRFMGRHLSQLRVFSKSGTD
jgi:hypothetical protein